MSSLLLVDRVVLETRVGPDQDKAKSRPIYPYVLLVVLSIHSATVGVALGLQSEAVTSLLVIVAILCHKGSAGFSFVVGVAATGAERRQLWTVLAIFASMTPLGTVLGTIASGLLEGPTAVLVEGSFNALAAGTFIYMAILDVINAEMSSADDRVAHFVRSAMVGDDDLPMPVQDTDRVLKLALVVVGLLSMAAVGSGSSRARAGERGSGASVHALAAGASGRRRPSQASSGSASCRAATEDAGPRRGFCRGLAEVIWQPSRQPVAARGVRQAALTARAARPASASGVAIAPVHLLAQLAQLPVQFREPRVDRC